ncbi:MAG: Tat pathway signal protein [Candidatus Eisenbacteria bacterium]|nr:Tat pathway signal protein [Candidatus Eisenbacteria bacterium]
MRKRLHPLLRRFRLIPGAAVIAVAAVAAGCGGASEEARESVSFSAERAEAFLDTLEERTFLYFWETADPRTGLAPDRAPTRSFMSTAATGFALTAYPIGAERGYVTREAAAERVRTTLHFFLRAPRGTDPSACAGHRGFFYHFLDRETGCRFGEVELSTVDTALLLAGALFCRGYFDRDEPVEGEIRAATDSLYARVDWTWAQPRAPMIVHGWTPEAGFLPYDWRGYNEAMILYILALASPTHPVGADAYEAWLAGYRWGEFHGREQIGFAPLFGHQYTHVWIDFRGVQDRFTREKGIDYFENSRRAALSQRDYAVENPGGWIGYGELAWGLTACDGPVHGQWTIGGRERRFQTYWARGASFTEIQDDGTLCPSAAAASIAFAPDVVLPTLLAMRAEHGGRLFSDYGFLDSFNPTFVLDVPVQHGRVHGAKGWYDTDYIGIDQGPILAMIENHRTGLVWSVMRRNPHILRGLRAAGFTGGWLDTARADR